MVTVATDAALLSAAAHQEVSAARGGLAKSEPSQGYS